MAVLFDSGPSPRAEHDEQLGHLLARTGTRIAVSHLGDRLSRTRVEHWAMGSHHLFLAQGEGLVLSLSAESDASEAIRIGYQAAGRYRLTAPDHEEEGGAGRVNITDQTQTCQFSQTGARAAAVSFEISFAQLAIRPDVIRRARSRLSHSAVYPVLQAHLSRLCATARAMPLPDQKPTLGEATLLLARAAIVSAADTRTHACAGVGDALYEQIIEYVLGHLTEQSLTPERIAAQHNISVRHLYRIWSRTDTGIAEWIMTERLAGAARDLRDPTKRTLTVASIARDWGLIDPAHFSRRFRLMYSMSPREWRMGAPTGHERR